MSPPFLQQTEAKAYAQQITSMTGLRNAIIDVCHDLMSQWLGLGQDASYKSAQVMQFFIDQLGAEATLIDLRKFDISTSLRMEDLQSKLKNIASVSGAPNQANLTAILYWKAASNSNHNSFLTAAEPTPFLDLWNHFRNSKVQGWDKEHHWIKVFPEIGPLQAYLIASDYAIAGLATIPTPAEMAKVILTINSSGIKGLCLLNLPWSNENEIASSLQYVYEYLLQEIPTMQQEQMKFNIFVIEHSLSLCKMSQASSNSAIAQNISMEELEKRVKILELQNQTLTAKNRTLQAGKTGPQLISDSTPSESVKSVSSVDDADTEKSILSKADKRKLWHCGGALIVFCHLWWEK
ncbi:uncharacterized protein EV420DRAFT_1649201 [Desarmillaria tabescens]|uniref:Uncharacterized protein n=1 Tax=Armillaria tabescens TaxID=1929756 RepID=A0AA39JN18_ARMTA|nr:uncharacterized protein EV420DRAFT_1649201 [Desarmillaria tabescens]KAK0443413.1 hypothetical protein EV420DRAFT_1649201 [Desarmillaria tabescens]